MFPPPTPDNVSGECVVSSSVTGKQYHVNLDEMTCECQYGAAWRWSNNKWQPNILCDHKLKAVASLCKKYPDDILLREYYDQWLGKKYNVFEAISAFHKELRFGNTDEALYWATVVIPHRGRHGVVFYMRNILFEETRDLSLAKYILKLASQGKSISLLDMQRAVRRFCAAPKKWELPWRHDLFLDEMRGYKKLGERFGYEVARPKDIIPEKHHKELVETMLTGFKESDRVQVQYGLKGWFKSKSGDHDHMKIDIFNTLIEVLNGEHSNSFGYNEKYAHHLQTVLHSRLRNHGAIGYHELNAFADALTGEPGSDPRASLPSVTHKRIVNHPKVQRPELGKFRKIPLYAHDNHTWTGKAKMKSCFSQLRPGAEQTDIDFRMCGAYMGVAWRTLAFMQHGTIDCKWSSVSWKPNWLWSHLDKMWY